MFNRKPAITLLSLVFAAVLSAPARADELLPQQHYADELQRCIAAIRAELSLDSDAALQHRVTRVAKENIWYAFDIATVQSESQQRAEQILAESECRAWRFDEKTVATVKKPESGPAQFDALSAQSRAAKLL